MLQAPADDRTELNTFLFGNSRTVLEILGRLGAASSPAVGEGRCFVPQIRGLFLLFTWFGGISCMICKLMGARWLFRRWCIRLQAILTLVEEFLDLGCLYVFKLYLVFCFEVSLGFETSVLKFPWVMFSSFSCMIAEAEWESEHPPWDCPLWPC